MCLIIDANVAHYFSDPRNKDALLVRDWIEAKSGRLVVGGRNARELAVPAWMSRWLLQLSRAGRMSRVSDHLVDAEEARLERSALCQSDDPHVIALARQSGARILYSQDQLLHEDFRNKALVDNPRGRVYQKASHKHLLNDNNCGARVP